MNNKLPAWGEILLHYCASQKCKNGFSSQRPQPASLNRPQVSVTDGFNWGASSGVFERLPGTYLMMVLQGVCKGCL